MCVGLGAVRADSRKLVSHVSYCNQFLGNSLVNYESAGRRVFLFAGPTSDCPAQRSIAFTLQSLLSVITVLVPYIP